MALTHLNRPTNIEDPCWDLLNSKIQTEPSCKDIKFSTFALWIKHDKQKSKLATHYKSIFIKIYKKHIIHEKIARLNLYNYNIWDVESTEYLKPFLVDLVLSLPEYREYRLQILDHLKL